MTSPETMNAADVDEHDLGFMHDLQTIERMRLGRRRALAWLGSASGLVVLSACGADSLSSGSVGSVTPTPTPAPTSTSTPTPTPTASGSSCGVPATETAGPYPADGTNSSAGLTSNALVATGVVRSDIRSSFVGSSTTVAPGVAMTFTITVVDANNACAPLAGYAVYLWHCNALGQYSLYDLPTESYLRGVQITDADGQVTFTTIVPGCYAGRYPHMHFEVFSSQANATSGRSAVLVSQFAVPAAVCTAVYSGASATYGQSGSRFPSTSITADNVFGDNSSAQMTVMTPTMSGSVDAGYTATATVGIAT